MKSVPLSTRKLMSHMDIRRIDDLEECAKDLEMVRDRVRKAVAHTQAMPEFRHYTEGWLTAFCSDLDQSGSIASLISCITDKYVDEDGEPWEKDH